MKSFKFTLPLFWILVIGLLNFAPTAAADPQFKEILATPVLLQKLQQGGFVFYMRHGNTDSSRGDRFPHVDLNDCSTQRVLNPLGHQVTQQIGDYIKQAQIPIGDVFCSPLCRAKDSAINAFGHYTVELALMYTGGMTSEQKKPVLAKTRALISLAVESGTNRVLVAHAPNLMDLIGYYPAESTLVIFIPKGNDAFEYIGSIRPQDWPALLNTPNLMEDHE